VPISIDLLTVEGFNTIVAQWAEDTRPLTPDSNRGGEGPDRSVEAFAAEVSAISVDPEHPDRARARERVAGLLLRGEGMVWRRGGVPGEDRAMLWSALLRLHSLSSEIQGGGATWPGEGVYRDLVARGIEDCGIEDFESVYEAIDKDMERWVGDRLLPYMDICAIIR